MMNSHWTRITLLLSLITFALPETTWGQPPQRSRNSEFQSNMVIGYSQVAQWYRSFEREVPNNQWELLWNPGGGVDKWSNPNFEGWNRPIQSPCTQRSGDPDRIVYSISGPYGDDLEQWMAKIAQATQVIQTKFPKVQQIVLLPVIGGPGTTRAARQHPTIAEAITRVVKADRSGKLVQGPFVKVKSTADFRDTKGHLTRTSSLYVGKQIGEYYSSKP